MDVQPRLNLETSSPLELEFYKGAYDAGLPHQVTDSWPVERAADLTATDGVVASRVSNNNERSEAVWDFGHGLAYLERESDGTLRVRCHADSPEYAQAMCDTIHVALPEREENAADKIEVGFWTAHANHGGSKTMREIDAPSWDEIADNYPDNSELQRLMSQKFEAGTGGQLLLWQGEAGTGKTSALRALLREWRTWCRGHYIVDPEAFFGNRADYMMQVLLEGGVTYYDGTEKEKPTWRLLILEDCGELLAVDAKQDVGQALSRLLNACDGLIGRGLRILVLVTTNEELQKLHQAVQRPGRCAARVKFPRFTRDQAAAWLEARKQNDQPINEFTLAELYGRVNNLVTQTPASQAVGFTKE